MLACLSVCLFANHRKCRQWSNCHTIRPHTPKHTHTSTPPACVIIIFINYVNSHASTVTHTTHAHAFPQNTCILMNRHGARRDLRVASTHKHTRDVWRCTAEGANACLCWDTDEGLQIWYIIFITGRETQSESARGKHLWTSIVQTSICSHVYHLTTWRQHPAPCLLTLNCSVFANTWYKTDKRLNNYLPLLTILTLQSREYLYSFLFPIPGYANMQAYSKTVWLEIRKNVRIAWNFSSGASAEGHCWECENSWACIFHLIVRTGLEWEEQRDRMCQVHVCKHACKDALRTHLTLLFRGSETERVSSQSTRTSPKFGKKTRETKAGVPVMHMIMRTSGKDN